MSTPQWIRAPKPHFCFTCKKPLFKAFRISIVFDIFGHNSLAFGGPEPYPFPRRMSRRRPFIHRAPLSGSGIGWMDTGEASSGRAAAPVRLHLGINLGFYSYLRVSTGSAMAALMVWTLKVDATIIKAAAAEIKNTSGFIAVR